MRTRILGHTGKAISEIGLGTWQLGTPWGQAFNAAEAERILTAAWEQGITFVDTADVYNGGESEKAIGRFLKAHPDAFYVTTKIGRRAQPHTPESYTRENVLHFIDDSLHRLQTEKLDMVLLHCPPAQVYARDDVFAALDDAQKAGKIASYGVSIEKVDEGIAAMEYGIAAMEVIFNMFRLKPLDTLFPMAQEKQIGIIARVSLASGLLTGRYAADTVFAPGDHRSYNRDGAAFDKGETFSGIPYALGLTAVDALKEVFGTDALAPLAIRWLLMHPAVSVVIPGASRTEQVLENVRAASLPALTDDQMQAVKNIYNTYLRDVIHPQW